MAAIHIKRRRIDALRTQEDGVAMIEFAFALPIFVLLLLGGLEITNLTMAHMRVSQIAITVADNAGRVRTGIDEADVYEVFSGAETVGHSLNFASNGRLVLSSLEPNGQTGHNSGQMINWQRCHGTLNVNPSYGRQNDGRTNSTLADGMGPVAKRIKAGQGTAVMFVEVTYRYTPLVFESILGESRDIRYESAFNVRERTNQNITNTGSLTVKAC